MLVVFAHIGGPTGLQDKIFHSNIWWDRIATVGDTGVDIFFVISGFIMVVTTARLEHGFAGARGFLWRRITRVYPPYLVITTLLFIVYEIKPNLINSSQAVRPDVLASFLLLPQVGLPLLLVGWTLVYEMYFYLIFTVGLLVPKRIFPIALGVWAVFTAVMNAVPGNNAWLTVASNPLNYEFLFGTVIGWLYVSGRMKLPLLFAGAGAIAALGLYAAVMAGHEDIVNNYWSRVFLVGLAVAVMIYGVVGLELDGKLVSPRPFVALGAASYSLYLTHVGLYKVISTGLKHHQITNVGVDVVGLVVAIAAAIVVAGLYYRLIETPLLKLIHDRVGRKPASGLPA